MTQAEKVCLGYGLVTKAAGEQRDSGVEKGQAIEKILASSGNKDPAQISAGRKLIEQAASLAYSNRRLSPWTLHALGGPHLRKAVADSPGSRFLGDTSNCSAIGILSASRIYFRCRDLG